MEVQLRTGDAFETMEELIKNGERFELIIIDPPSFAKSRKHREKALNAYTKLIRLGLRLVTKKGIFVMASCSSRIKAEEFKDLIEKTAKKENCDLELFELTGHAFDHPVTITEAQYLKCAYCKIP